MNPLLLPDDPPVAAVDQTGRSRTLVSVLVTAPDLQLGGGVAHYYATLKPHLADEVEYLAIGARAGCREPVGGVVRLLRDYRRFYRQLRSRRHDLVHLNSSLRCRALLRDGVFLLIAKWLRRKVIVFMHGWSSACEHAIRRRYLFLFRSVYLRADAFVVLSSRFKASLRDLGYARPVYVETTAVPDEVFRHSEGKNTPAGAESKRLNILFLSRIERAKGIYEAVDAFRLLRAKYPLVTMTVAGAGSELAAVREYVSVKRTEGIQFAGWLTGPQKQQAFAQADIYLFPTRWPEGMPISVLEAMGYGLPIITRPVGGLRDFFEQGTMGFMTDSRDPEVFASLLEQLVCDERLRSQIGDYNRRYAMNRFRASQAARRLGEIYRAVAEGSRPAANTCGRTESCGDQSYHPCQKQSR
jgi:glycosyltransferase involved in cell wall biosynthesis